MHKQAMCGVDVSMKWLDANCARPNGQIETGRFDNTAKGHRQLLGWASKRKAQVRVVMEATGTYGLAFALAAVESKRVEVMVANPRAVKDFAGALLQRSRTDATSAEVLRQYGERMEFVPYVPPPKSHLELSSISRRIAQLVKMRAKEKNRVHACAATPTAALAVAEDLHENIEALEARVQSLETKARELIASDQKLEEAYGHLCSIKGVAQTSAIAILGEVMLLPASMSVRQWVAHAGLDPRTEQSGISVNRPARISKIGSVHLRRALYMPAVVAREHEPHVRHFADKLAARGKPPLVVYVAIMRKLLHSIHAMLRTGTDFDGQKFCVMA